jgi:hypothetical protein
MATVTVGLVTSLLGKNSNQLTRAGITDIRYVLAGVALLSLLLIANGAYIIVCGKIGPNWSQIRDSGKTLSHPQRFFVAALYILFGISALLLVLTHGRS